MDPRTGQHPVARVCAARKCSRAGSREDAPDLLLEPAPLYRLTHARHAVEPADWISGDHRMDGVLVAAGPNVDREAFPETANLVDLAPTILAASGTPSSVRHTGRGAHRGGGRRRGGGGRATPRARSRRPTTAEGLDEAEAEEVEEHLRGLGYLE